MWPHWSQFNPDTAETLARVRSIIEWLACDLKTGAKVAYLPGVRGTISRALGAYTSDTLSVPAPLAGPLSLGPVLDQAIEVPTRMLVAVINDVPAWGGIIWKVRGGTGATIELGCATPESYLDRRYIGDLEFGGIDQSGIVSALIGEVNTEGINLAIDAPPTGVLRDRTYWDDENATYYQRLQELMEVEGGPEWTIDLDWADPLQRAVKLIARVRTRIGSEVPRGPIATRSRVAASYTYSVDYGKSKGANDVLAYSSGEGVDKPVSQHIRNNLAIASGVPRIEHRFQPSSSIKNISVLNSHANAELHRLDGGTTSLEIQARWNVAPARLGIDLKLGDTVEYDLVGHMHPAGIQGTARMVGWRLDTTNGTFAPVLVQEA